MHVFLFVLLVIVCAPMLWVAYTLMFVEPEPAKTFIVYDDGFGPIIEWE